MENEKDDQYDRFCNVAQISNRHLSEIESYKHAISVRDAEIKQLYDALNNRKFGILTSRKDIIWAFILGMIVGGGIVIVRMILP
jgi:hypothetical protein